MNVVNTTGQWIHLTAGYSLPPGQSAYIDDLIYRGNKTLNEQVNRLFKQDKIYVTEPDIKEVVEEQVAALTATEDGTVDDPFPTTFYIDEWSIEIHRENRAAIFGIEEGSDGEDYGIVELDSTSGSTIKLSSSTNEVEKAMLSVSKVGDREGKVLLFKVNGKKIFEIDKSGNVAFNGVAAIAQQELDPGTASTTDIVDALIALGLIKST